MFKESVQIKVSIKSEDKAVGRVSLNPNLAIEIKKLLEKLRRRAKNEQVKRESKRI